MKNNGDNNDISVLDTFRETFLKRLSSPAYGIFIISWILWNWEVFYVTFFIDSDLLFEKYRILKIDYIKLLHPSFFSFLDHILIYPFISFLFITFVVSKITLYFNKILWEQEKEQATAKNDIFIERLNQESKIVDKQTDIFNKKEELILRKEKLWNKEYNEIKNDENLFKIFKEINNCVNNDDGYIKESEKKIVNFRKEIQWFIEKDIISFSPTDLYITLTPQGNHLKKKYEKENVEHLANLLNDNLPTK